MKRLPLLFLFCLLFSAGSLAQTVPEITVQISTTRDAQDSFTNWQVLMVTWDTVPYAVVGDHQPIARKALQTWAAFDGQNWWKFTFKRNIVGTYAIRYCIGPAAVDSIWSETQTAAIVRGESPRAR